MRIFLVLAIFLTLLGLGVSYFTGMIAEQKLSGMQNSLAAQQYIQLLSAQHQRGWLNSLSSSQVELPQGLGKLDLQHQISHGLVPVKAVNVETLVGLNDNLHEQLQVYLGEMTQPEINTQIIVWQPIKFSVHVPRPEQKGYALHGKAEFIQNPVQVDGEFFLETLSMPQARRALALQATNIQVHATVPAAQTFVLQTELRPQYAKLDLLHQADLVLQHIVLKLQAQLQADVLNVHIELFVPQLQAGDKTFEQLKLVLQVDNLDWQILQKYLALLQKTPMQQRFMLPMFLLQNAKPFLSRQPFIQLKQFELKNSQDELQGQLTLQVDNTEIHKLNRVSALLQTLHLQSDIRLGKSLAQQILSILLIEEGLTPDEAAQKSQEMLEQQIHFWQQRGLVSEDETNYYSQVEWKEGKLQACVGCQHTKAD